MADTERQMLLNTSLADKLRVEACAKFGVSLDDLLVWLSNHPALHTHGGYVPDNLSTAEQYQARAADWAKECFGLELATNRPQRNHRFLEEALELVQACELSREDAHSLVDYVYDRPVGDRAQEAGGAMLTLSLLCNAQGLDMNDCGANELERVLGCIDKVRERQLKKPATN